MCIHIVFPLLQDLLEREHRNQDAIETEKADLMKFTEVCIHVYWPCNYKYTKLHKQTTCITCYCFYCCAVLLLCMQEKNNEILSYNNQVNGKTSGFHCVYVIRVSLQLAQLQTRLEKAQSNAVKWLVNVVYSCISSYVYTHLNTYKFVKYKICKFIYICNVIYLLTLIYGL